jgi:hypothetical protein
MCPSTTHQPPTTTYPPPLQSVSLSSPTYVKMVYLYNVLFLFPFAVAAVLAHFFCPPSQREGHQVPAALAVAMPPLIRQPIPSEVRNEPKECRMCGRFDIKHSSSFYRHQKLCRGPGAPKVFPCGTWRFF